MTLTKRLESIARAALEPSSTSPERIIMDGLHEAGYRGSYERSAKTRRAFHAVADRWITLFRELRGQPPSKKRGHVGQYAKKRKAIST